MSNIKRWEFPVPSTYLTSSGVKLVYPGGKAYLLFEYYDTENDDEIFHSGIMFEAVMTHKHTSEKFLTTLLGAYDALVEIEDSDWLAQCRAINEDVFDFWNLKHYAIFLDSNGMYEFVAKGFTLLETESGGLSELLKIK
jgi:hypothetical protein